MSDELQFEKAEFAEPQALVCSACKAPIVADYYAVNGKIFCERCVAGIRQFVGDGFNGGRFLRSAIFGAGAAVAGMAVYAAVMIGTRTEWAIVSIGIGIFVGKAVRKGSGHLGGWPYQLLAALLTYTAICAAYAANFVYAFGPPYGPNVARIAPSMFALPFEEGAHNAIGWLIIGFGVWQAWQSNRAAVLQITGPHALGTVPTSSGA